MKPAGYAVAFEDGSFAVRADLNVNPDGTKASYLVGDHGFTYVANGVDLWRNGQRLDCRRSSNQCRKRFLEAESRAFGEGTDEFCAFAFEVEPPAGARKTACRDGIVVGNGKGQPMIGGTLLTAGGARLPYYVSTTSLKHTVGGKSEYFDSSVVPSVVVPRSRARDLGQVVWVSTRSMSHGTFAIVADVGPAYGEGSIALHQHLRSGQIVEQSPGPIPRELRCREAELGLREPFGSRPDISGDLCGSARAPQGSTDIRAYVGMKQVDSLYLGKARFAPQNGVITDEVDTASLQARAASSGYSSERIREMLNCLGP